MLATLAKYRQVFLTGLQSNIVYRINFTVRGFFSLFHLAAVVILWSAAASGTGKIGDFTLGQTITYFVTLLVLQFFISAFNEDYQISEEIRNGLINQFLLKPINYFAYRFSIFLAARLVSGLMVFVPLLVALPFIREHLTYPSDIVRVLAFGLPAMAMSAMIQFSIAYCFGLLSFWFLEIQGFVILSMALETLLGGQMFPLDLLPTWAYSIAKCLPFYYQMYFPAAIFTGRLTDATAIFQGYGIQAAWVIALLLVNKALWVRGLREHTAVGG